MYNVNRGGGPDRHMTSVAMSITRLGHLITGKTAAARIDPRRTCPPPACLPSSRFCSPGHLARKATRRHCRLRNQFRGCRTIRGSCLRGQGATLPNKSAPLREDFPRTREDFPLERDLRALTVATNQLYDEPVPLKTAARTVAEVPQREHLPGFSADVFGET